MTEVGKERGGQKRGGGRRRRARRREEMQTESDAGRDNKRERGAERVYMKY